MKNIIRLNAIFISIIGFVQSRNVKFKDDLKIYFNSDSTKYIKGITLAQYRLRYNDNNLSSTIYETSNKETFDVGLKRLRYQLMSQFNKKTFFNNQFGINSFDNLSVRKFPLFFHDVSAKYNGYKNFIASGVGLSGWNGTLRYTSLGVDNILGLDISTIDRFFGLVTLLKEPIFNSNIKN